MAIPHSTVLIAEDEPMIRLGLAMAFEDAGYHVLEAGTVLEAISIFSRHQVDALVTDIDMPGGLTGLDLAELVSAVSKAAVVIVSGGGIPLAHQLPTGTAFFSKPYDAARVIAEVRTQIEHKMPYPFTEGMKQGIAS